MNIRNVFISTSSVIMLGLASVSALGVMSASAQHVVDENYDNVVDAQIYTGLYSNKLYILSTKSSRSGEYRVDPDGTRSYKVDLFLDIVSSDQKNNVRVKLDSLFSGDKSGHSSNRGAIYVSGGDIRVFFSEKDDSPSNYAQSGYIYDSVGDAPPSFERSTLFSEANAGWMPYFDSNADVHHFIFSGYREAVNGKVIGQIEPDQFEKKSVQSKINMFRESLRVGELNTRSYSDSLKKFITEHINGKGNNNGSSLGEIVVTGSEDNDKSSGMIIKSSNCIKGNCENGVGVYSDSLSDVYAGQFLNGKRHGNGVEIREGLIYNGQFKDGKFEGRGVITFKSGSNGGEDTYIGDFSDGNFRHNSVAYLIKGDVRIFYKVTRTGDGRGEMEVMREATANEYCRNNMSISCTFRFVDQNKEVIGAVLALGYLSAVVASDERYSLNDINSGMRRLENVMERRTNERAEQFAARLANSLGLNLR